MKKLILLAAMFAAVLSVSAQRNMQVWGDGSYSEFSTNDVDSVTFLLSPNGTPRTYVTPQFKIESDYWFVSYDEGMTWTQLGKATGEQGAQGPQGEKGDTGAQGPKGDKGDKGDSMFLSVTQDDNYIYLLMTDSTKIQIAKAKTGGEGTHADDDFIEFKDLNVKSALLRHTPEIDTNHDGEISYAEAKATKRIVINGNEDIISFKELQYFENLTSACFSGCSKLFEVGFPARMDSISDYAFQGCTLLPNFKVPVNCKYIGKYAFNACKGMTAITFEEGSKCEYIGEQAFGGCTSLTHIEFPNSVKYIGNYVLNYCGNIQSITFPESYVAGGPIVYPSTAYTNVQTIVWNAICCPQYRFSVPITTYGLAGYIDGYPPYYAPNIKEVYFGNKVTTIPAYLCYKMDKLQDLAIPESVTSIGDYAFEGCSKLTKITIPDAVTIIGNSAFKDTGLREVTIGKKVESIGRYAFNTCGKIYCKAQQPPIIDLSFPSSVSVIYVPRESVEEYRVIWSDFANKILGYDFE